MGCFWCSKQFKIRCSRNEKTCGRKRKRRRIRRSGNSLVHGSIGFVENLKFLHFEYLKLCKVVPSLSQKFEAIIRCFRRKSICFTTLFSRFLSSKAICLLHLDGLWNSMSLFRIRNRSCNQIWKFFQREKNYPLRLCSHPILKMYVTIKTAWSSDPERRL